MNEVTSTALTALKSDISNLKLKMQSCGRAGSYKNWQELNEQRNVLLKELAELLPRQDKSIYNEFLKQHRHE